MKWVYLKLVTEVFNIPAVYPHLMAGEDKNHIYRQIRAYVSEMRAAVKLYELNQILNSPADTDQVTGLAKRVADAIARATAGAAEVPARLTAWQLEAEGALLNYSETDAQAQAFKGKDMEACFLSTPNGL